MKLLSRRLALRVWTAAVALAALTVSSVLVAGGGEARAPSEGVRVYVGTYTGKQSQGIYVFKLDGSTGKATAAELAAKTENPSFLAIHPSGRFVYAVNEVDQLEGQPGGAASAFSVEPASGKLTLLNRKPSGGAGPCHLVVDRAGKHVLAANYGGGSVIALAIEPDGRLGERTAFVQHRGKGVNPSRQEGPHAHSINLDPANRFALVSDLGLDRVFVYRFDAEKGSLEPNDPPSVAVTPGAGPRHFAFHPQGLFGYSINEMNLTVTAFTYQAERGVLREGQTAGTLPPGSAERGFSTAEVVVHPSGRFLYGSNRGHDSISVFAIQGLSGELKAVQFEPTRGKTPRSFGIDPTGTYLLAANQGSDTIVVFRIDPQTGRLQATGEVITAPSPVCVQFLPGR